MAGSKATPLPWSVALGVDVNGLDVRCPIVSLFALVGVMASGYDAHASIVKWESSSGANLGDDLSSVTSLLYYVAVCFPCGVFYAFANVGNHPSSTRRGFFASFCLASPGQSWGLRDESHQMGISPTQMREEKKLKSSLH